MIMNNKYKILYNIFIIYVIISLIELFFYKFIIHENHTFFERIPVIGKVLSHFAIYNINHKQIWVNENEIKIPKIIHQTWCSKDKNDSIDNLRKTWINNNPDFKYIYYDDNDINDFIKTYFSSDIYNCYKRIIAGTLKADFFRYCVLYIHGGFYIDIDNSCIKPLAEVIEPNTTLVTTTDHCSIEKSDRIYQAFLGSVPHCKLFMMMIKHIMKNMNAGYFKYDLFQLSGPVIFSDLLKKYINHNGKQKVRFLSEQKIIKPETEEQFEIFTHNIHKEQLEKNGLVIAKSQHVIDRGDNLHYYDDIQKFDNGFYQ